MPCKPGVASPIPGFSIKTTFGEPLGVPVIKPTKILNQPGGTGLYPGKPLKRYLIRHSKGHQNLIMYSPPLNNVTIPVWSKSINWFRK